MQGHSWLMIQVIRTQPGDAAEEGWLEEEGRDFFDLVLCAQHTVGERTWYILGAQGHLPQNIDRGRDGGDAIGRSRNEIIGRNVKK